MGVSGYSESMFKFWKKIGPCFITGAADDDPSGIATYSIAGAQFGYKMNWLTLFLIPAMISIQEMCGKIGLVSGRGLAGAIKKYYSVKLTYAVLVMLTVANVINIGADLGIIAASIEMVLGGSKYFWLVLSAVVIVALEVMVTYKTYAKYLKWSGAMLLVYVATALMVKQDWGEVARYTLIPHLEWNLEYMMTMVGFLGTTISPYLFFWQASEEVEEAISKNQIIDFGEGVPKVTKKRIRNMEFDTVVGMLFSNMITFFVILTTTATLFRNGIHTIATPQEAALALRPLAGDAAYLLFALGIIGIGLQSIPVLAGSLAYAASDTLGFKGGLSKKPMEAKWFYGVIALATLLGVLINFLGINTMAALYYAAVVNGVVAVPLIFVILKIAGDKNVMGKYRVNGWKRKVGWLTLIFMAMAVVVMVVGVVRR